MGADGGAGAGEAVFISAQRAIPASPAAVAAVIDNPANLRRCAPGLTLGRSSRHGTRLTVTMRDELGALPWRGHAIVRCGDMQWEASIEPDGRRQGSAPRGSLAATVVGRTPDSAMLAVSLELTGDELPEALARWQRVLSALADQYLRNAEAITLRSPSLGRGAEAAQQLMASPAGGGQSAAERPIRAFVVASAAAAIGVTVVAIRFRRRARTRGTRSS